jgi:hypothetical protein
MKNLQKAAVAAAVFAVTTHTASAWDGQNRHFHLVNRTPWTIVAVHISHIDKPTFPREDLLGTYVVEPGKVFGLVPRNDQGYCRFDIQLEFENGGVQNIMDVNLCKRYQVITYGWGRYGYRHDTI